MRRLLAVWVALCAPAAALAETFKNVPLIDEKCQKLGVKDPDQHLKYCLLKCVGSGYGILAGNTWLKLDEAGNEKALAALKSTGKNDHIRVNVTGERKGDRLQVSSLSIPD